MVLRPSVVVLLVLTVFLALLPLQWITLLQVGGLNVKPPHVAISLLTAALVLLPGLRRSVLRFLGTIRVFVGAYCAYLAVHVMSFAWTEITPLGAPLLAKTTLYFLVFIVLGGTVQHLGATTLRSAALLGPLLGVGAFAFMAVGVFSQLGRNLPLEYATALVTGDAVRLQFAFYPDLFNFRGDEVISRQADDWAGTSLRNTLIGAFVLYFCMLRLQRTADAAAIRRPLNIALSTALVVLIVASLSRSNIIALALCGALATAPMVLQRRSSGGLLATGLALVGAVAAIAAVLTMFMDMVDSVGERIAAIQNDSRLGMYSTTLDLVLDRPLAGYGVGSVLPGPDQQHVHNLFLGAWYQCGILGLLASVAYYLAILGRWASGVSRAMLSGSAATHWVWLYTLPILPLIRSLLSGQNGNFTLMEWTCLALFFALTQRDGRPIKALREATAPGRAGAQHKTPGPPPAGWPRAPRSQPH